MGAGDRSGTPHPRGHAHTTDDSVPSAQFGIFEDSREERRDVSATNPLREDGDRDFPNRRGSRGSCRRNVPDVTDQVRSARRERQASAARPRCAQESSHNNRQ